MGGGKPSEGHLQHVYALPDRPTPCMRRGREVHSFVRYHQFTHEMGTTARACQVCILHIPYSSNSLVSTQNGRPPHSSAHAVQLV